jgi:HPt (histidine-containing phosphotransfer) domain-containing protein
MTTMTFKFINLDYLDTMTGGDDSMRDEMLGMLKAEIPDELGKMTESAAASDWEEVFQISHKFKTTLSFIGYDKMIALNKTVEYCTRNKVDLHEIPQMIQSLVKMSKNVMEELKAV